MLQLTLALIAAVPVPADQGPKLADRPAAFETRGFRLSGTQVLLNTGSVLARPFRPEPVDIWVIIPTLIGTAIAINTDVLTHKELQKIPDPLIGDKQLSYWVSYLGEGWVDVVVFLAFGILGGRDGQRVAIAGLQALAATGIASLISKRIFRLERPTFDREQQHWFSRFEADAMPAGHAMTAFATAAVLSREYPRLSPLFYGLALWVGLARVQQSAHWVSDIVVGAALGTLFGWQSWAITEDTGLEFQPWANGSGGGLTVGRSF